MIKPGAQANLSFDLISEIGSEGKNSKVFRARDLQLDAELAIKQIQKASFTGASEYYKEASILYLSDHANVVPIHYACEDNDHIYLAMPFFQNGSLNSLLKNRFLTVREIVRYGIQFLSGLHNIHSKGLLHFDIKPDNIMLSPRNEALVSDFGLAQRMQPNGAAEPPVSYWKNIPPEALAQAQHTVAFDIYQSGLTLYRMCGGNDPFYTQLGTYPDIDAFTTAVQAGKFPDRAAFPAHIPSPLRNLVKKCLEVDLNKRFGSIVEVSNALAAIDGKELDWQYTVAADGTRSWQKTVDEKELSIVVDPSGNAVATKKTAKTVAKIKDYCISNITDKQLRAFLKEALT